MTKQEFLAVLLPELKRLEEVEHLRDLTRNGRYDEAQAVVEEIDYSSFNKYGEACCIYRQKCCLEVSDIPEEYLVTFTLYLVGNREYNEVDVMKCWEKLQEAVAEQGEDGAIIAGKMKYDYLTNFYTIADLMSSDEDYEDDEYYKEEAID